MDTFVMNATPSVTTLTQGTHTGSSGYWTQCASTPWMSTVNKRLRIGPNLDYTKSLSNSPIYANDDTQQIAIVVEPICSRSPSLACLAACSRHCRSSCPGYTILKIGRTQRIQFRGRRIHGKDRRMQRTHHLKCRAKPWRMHANTKNAHPF